MTGATTASAAEASPTITQVIEPYWNHAQGYYVKNGRPTDEVGCIRVAMRIWRRHYGDTPAAEFDSLKLLALQEIMVREGWARKTVYDHLGRVKRALKWMVSRKLIPPSVWHECMTVTGLERGRSRARETAPKKPVPEEHIEAVEPWVSRQVWALIQLQLFTGARPGEPEPAEAGHRPAGRSGRRSLVATRPSTTATSDASTSGPRRRQY